MKNKLNLGQRRNVNKRGISPLLATVILVGLTISLAVFMANWQAGVTERTIGISQKMIDSSEIIGIKVSNTMITDYSKVSTLVENEENRNISDLMVIVSGNLGTDSIITEGLLPYQSKVINVSYDLSKTGENITKVSVIPISESNNELLIHKLSEESTVKIEEVVTDKCLSDLDKDGINDCLDLDDDNDGCMDNEDYDKESFCPRFSCSLSINGEGCNEICEPFKTDGSKDSCECLHGSVISCLAGQECVNNECLEKQNKCELLDAYWNRNNVKAYEEIELVVEGSNCQNITLTLNYSEVDIFTRDQIYDEKILGLPETMEFNEEGTLAKANWSVKNIADKDGLNNYAEVVFIASYNPSIESDILSIDEQPPADANKALSDCGYSGGDWIVNEDVACSEDNILMDQDSNIVINNGASLTLDHVNITMVPLSNGGAGIINNGNLYINYSNITTEIDNLNGYIFQNLGSSKLILNNSYIAGVGYNGGTNVKGIYLTSDDNEISNNFIERAYRGLALEGSSSNFAENSIINNNTFYQIGSGSAIYLQYARDINLINNKIVDSSYHGIILDGNNEYIEIVNSSITSLKDGIYMGGSNYINITDNLIKQASSGSARTGINVASGDYLLILNNTISDYSRSTNYGIHLISSGINIKIINNTLIRNTVGLYLSNNDGGILVKNNNFTDNSYGGASTGEGIALWIVGSNNNITNNYFEGNGKVGTYRSSIVINNAIHNIYEDNIIMDQDANWHVYFETILANATLINTTFNKNKVSINHAQSSLETKWYMQVNVTDSEAMPIADANVVVKNLQDEIVYSTTTNAEGFTELRNFTEFIKDGIRTAYDSPYSIEVIKDGYENLLVNNVIVDQSKIVNVELVRPSVCGYDGTGDWIVNEGEEVICSNAEIDVNVNGNISIDGTLWLNNVTLKVNPSLDGNVWINNSGSLYINYSNISSVNGNNYLFRILENSNFTLIDSGVIDVGNDGIFVPNFPLSDSGLYIINNNSVISNSTIIGDLYQAIVIGDGGYNTINHTIINSYIQANYMGIVVGESGGISEYNLIENNTIKTSNSDGGGAGIITNVDSNFNNISRNKIISASQGLQIRSSYNLIEYCTINAGNYRYGLNINGDSNIVRNNSITSNSNIGLNLVGSNNLFYNNSVNTAGSDSVKINGYNNIFRRDKLYAASGRNNIDSVGGNGNLFMNVVTNNRQVSVSNNDNGLTLLNTTYNNVLLTVNGVNSNATIRWYMQVNVTDSEAMPIADANVVVKNLQDEIVYSTTTNAEGFTELRNFTEYLRENGDLDSYSSPYSVEVSKGDYGTLIMNDIVLDQSKIVNVELTQQNSCGYVPGQGDWNINQEMICKNNNITLDYGANVNIVSGGSLILINSSLLINPSSISKGIFVTSGNISVNESSLIESLTSMRYSFKFNGDNLIIENSTIREIQNSGNPFLSGLLLQSGNSTIINNTFENNYMAISVNSDNNTIKGNKIIGNGEGVLGVNIYYGNNNTVEDNEIRNMAVGTSYGIHILNGKNNLILDNYIHDIGTVTYKSTGVGIYSLLGRNNKFIGNKIEYTGQQIGGGKGIYVSASTNEFIYDNTLNFNKDAGISISGNSGNISVISNHINSVGANYGIYDWDVSDSFLNNITIYDNSMSGGSLDGIKMRFNNSNISSNSITNFVNSGIRISDGTNNSISENYLSQFSWIGLSFAGKNSEISYNNIKRADKIGFSLMGNNNLIDSNIIEENSLNEEWYGGVVIGDGDNNYNVENNTFINNIIRNNYIGFDVATNSKNNWLINTKIESSSWKGIDFYFDGGMPSGELILLNSSFDKTINYGSYNVKLIRKWYSVVKVTDSIGGLENVRVAGSNNNTKANDSFVEYTNVEGLSRMLNLTQYVQNRTGTYWFNNYSINASLNGYYDNVNTYLINDNSMINISMEHIIEFVNITNIDIDNVGYWQSCTYSGCYITPEVHSNVSNLNFRISTADNGVEDDGGNCDTGNRVAYINLCLINGNDGAECNATVANYSWKLDQIDETVFGDGRLGCNYTVSGLNSNDNTPEFYILPGEYKISANVTNNNWNKYNESNATWIYNELIAIGLTDNLNLDNEVSSVILGNNSIIIGAWSSGNHNYVMTNWGNVPLETAWNASDPEHENYPDPCGGIGNKWILQGDDMQLDDDSRHEDENNGEVSPIFLFGGDSNDNNPERVYGYDTGMTICSSYECNDVHNKLNAYFHIKPPSSLTCVGAYSNLIVYDVYAFQ